MQKVLQRTANAKKQHARKLEKFRVKREQTQRSIDAQQFSPVGKQIQQDLKNARKARREDWELGPLAPRRNVGTDSDLYGATDPRRLRGPEIPEEKRIEFWNIVERDRVVIIKGRDKGSIGRIKEVYKKSEEVIVEGLNMVDVIVPDYAKAEQDQRPIIPLEAAIPLSSVRLVFPLQDEQTGVKRDVIVKEIANKNPKHQRDGTRTSWSRYIPGLNVTIPWPKRPKEERKNTYDVDTLRINFEAETWVPSLISPPMPLSVIDELRNKYSIFRDRHDPEYIRKKEEEDQAAMKLKQSSILMRTPLQKANKQARKERKRKGKGRLTPEMLSRIGEAMAAKGSRLDKPQPDPV
ncbi:MAG: hypothetical protein M1812_005591 [Candelaria pacifica]|nr:MAG: hypothetical protein M1812_005591 [Candelaria pacifica]